LEKIALAMEHIKILNAAATSAIIYCAVLMKTIYKRAKVVKSYAVPDAKNNKG